MKAVSGTMFWPPIAAIIAKLRQHWPQLRARRKPLPAFPPGTKFLDVEGVPVSVTPRFVSTAWDHASPRPFPTDSAWRNGTPITEAEFRADVARIDPPVPSLEEWCADWRRAHPKGPRS
jgi:hypothetical protein